MCGISGVAGSLRDRASLQHMNAALRHRGTDGEIYNFLDLFAELEGRGHRFATRCDTEVLVHAYEEWGVDCVQHLWGMFAFAIWDSRERRLLLARDRLGKKSLVYYHDRDQGGLAFASELHAL